MRFQIPQRHACRGLAQGDLVGRLRDAAAARDCLENSELPQRDTNPSSPAPPALTHPVGHAADLVIAPRLWTVRRFRHQILLRMILKRTVFALARCWIRVDAEQ
ncbi:hypothetical protein [Sphingomonas colocasiae]|uniref:hypothetical protein n=1 Tax=Sphingomonas colocasiae TaxID=1848973 RepID=UPI001FE4AB21|nr:hypothetical protein [Sphingomonas colocasiae]